MYLITCKTFQMYAEALIIVGNLGIEYEAQPEHLSIVTDELEDGEIVLFERIATVEM